ncbi:hypothetical protein UU5_19631, partial [Rhodanobacter sp. 115]
PCRARWCRPTSTPARLLDWGTLGSRPSRTSWALYPSRRHVSARVSAFVQLLVDRFEHASPAAFSRLVG